MSIVGDLLPTLLPLLGGGASVVQGIRFVREGEAGIKLRFGKAVRYKTGPYAGQAKVIQPGLRLLIPFVDTLVRRHVRQQTIRSDNQEIMLKDKTVFHVSAVTIFKVVDVYRALFEIDDLDGSIDDFCMAVLRDYLSQKDAEGLESTQQMSEEMFDLLVAKGAEWGVEFISFRLTNCSPSSQTAELILTKSLTERRTEALEGVAPKFGGSLADINPSLAAALVGIPVAATISGARHGRKRTTDKAGHVTATEEYDEDED